MRTIATALLTLLVALQMVAGEVMNGMAFQQRAIQESAEGRQGAVEDSYFSRP
ncbi:MAG: hypothetical protein SO011_06640 [Prevotella sp.]|nr:hypothetical protein [Prevotella sp.]